MHKRSTPNPRRRSILKLMAGSVAGAGLHGIGAKLARAAEWPMTVMTRFYMRTLAFAIARRRFMLALPKAIIAAQMDTGRG